MCTASPPGISLDGHEPGLHGGGPTARPEALRLTTGLGQRGGRAAHRHAVLLAQQLHPDLVHVGSDVPLGLLQVLCVPLHQGFGDPTAAVLGWRGDRKQCQVLRPGPSLLPGQQTYARMRRVAIGKQHPKFPCKGIRFLYSQDVLEGILHIFMFRVVMNFRNAFGNSIILHFGGRIPSAHSA